MDTWIMIGVVCAILALLYRAINIPQIQPRTLKVIVVWLGRRMPEFIGVVFVFALSAFFIFVIYSTTRMSLQFDVILLDALIFWALLGIWSPVITKYDKLKKPFQFVNIAFFIFVMTGFWITQWPKWHTPALLTSFIVLVFILLFVDSFIRKRKTHHSG